MPPEADQVAAQLTGQLQDHLGRRPHVQTGPANHPGATAKPFMRPAFDTKKQEAIRVFAATVRTELAKELVKKGKGGAAAMALSGTRAVQAVEAVA